MKTTLEGINSRITEAEERISDLEDRMVDFTAAEQNREKRMKRNEDSLRDLWNNIKCNNIRILGVPEGEEREKGPEKTLQEIIVENFQQICYRGNIPKHIKAIYDKPTANIILSSKTVMPTLATSI